MGAQHAAPRRLCRFHQNYSIWHGVRHVKCTNFPAPPPPTSAAAAAQRAEEGPQRQAAGVLLSLAASAALVLGAGAAAAEVKLPPLDNGASCCPQS